MKEVFKVRVVTKNAIVDILASVKNFMGLRILQYEEMITKAKEDMWQEIKKEHIKIKWYRYEISQLTSGAIVIMLYGERV